MKSTLELQAADGVRIGADRFSTDVPARGGLVLIHEVFGVTDSIRAVASGYAHSGFEVIVPALFDRIEKDTVLPEDADGMRRGREFVGKLGLDAPLRDVRAAVEVLKRSCCARVSVIGYCWGGTLAYLCATRLGLPGVSYYGRQIPEFLHERLQAPIIFHFGEQDEFIPAATIEAVERAFPDHPVYRYPAGHAFNRVGQPPYAQHSAALALRRSLDFLDSLDAVSV